jgi:glycerophosphoryl diester phosphodiesterase
VVEDDLSPREKMMDPRATIPLIIAHRGASAYAPENTLAAFRRAAHDGAEGVEFDVRLTRDGETVVFHDATLRRTAGRDGAISELTLAELRTVDAGSWFNRRRPSRANPDFANETISSLAETLDLLKDFPGLIYVELKCGPGGVEELCEAACALIARSPLLPRIIVKSFELGAIPLVRRLCPNVQTAALFGAKLMNAMRKETRIIQAAKRVEAHQVSVHYSLATRGLMKKAAREELPVTIWTADNPRWVRRGAELGLKAIITNDPARMLQEKREIEKAHLI